MQCLLIDDDPDDQEIFLMILAEINQNIQCFTANDGVEALSMLEEKKAWTLDYIFMDVNMPKMNGMDCLKGICGFQHLKNTKIFMYSTTSENSVIEKSRKLGAHDFIIKQSSPTALKDILSKIFE